MWECSGADLKEVFTSPPGQAGRSAGHAIVSVCLTRQGVTGWITH
jgi:hypothetical protein